MPHPADPADPGFTTYENAVLHPDGRITPHDPELAPRDQIIVALAAGAPIALGQFLTGGLGQALTLNQQLGGPPLTPRQTDVLARLGRLRDYIPIAAPQSFRAILAPNAAPPPRALADGLRAPAAPQTERIAILPIRETEKFCLANRASVSAWLRARKITIIDPEALRLADLLAALASASLILLADPRQVGLLPLCHPGTKILQIAPDGWLGAQARKFSETFALDWTHFLATPPTYPLRGALPFGSLVPCSYEIPIRELAKTLDSL
jgi:hypothetical protein